MGHFEKAGEQQALRVNLLSAISGERDQRRFQTWKKEQF